MAGAGTMGLFLVSRRLGAVAAAAAVLMAATRVYVGAHYPHDVIVRLVLGGLVAGVGWLLLHRPLIWLVTMVDPFPLPTPSRLRVHRATLRELEPTTAQTCVETAADRAS
jgi:membrane-associated phospholipid phosphatase